MIGFFEKLSKDKKFKRLIPLYIDFEIEISALKKNLGEDVYKILTENGKLLSMEDAAALLLYELD